MKMKIAPLLLVFILLCSACGTFSKSGKTKRAPQRVVPIAIIIETRNNSALNFINMDYYRFRVLDKLDNFQGVDLTLVNPDENPEVVLNLNIDNFVLWPRDERVRRQVMSRAVQVGTDAAGKPIYQTARASVDIVQVEQRSNARLLVNLEIKGSPGRTFKRSFAPSYNYRITYADNIQGDSRAVDPRLFFSRSPGIEPDTMDFLSTLSQEVVDRVSSELRSFYRNE